MKIAQLTKYLHNKILAVFNDLTYSGTMYSITQIYRHGVYEKAPFTKYQQDDQGGHRVLKAQSALLGSQKEGGLGTWVRSGKC